MNWEKFKAGEKVKPSTAKRAGPKGQNLEIEVTLLEDREKPRAQ